VLIYDYLKLNRFRNRLAGEPAIKEFGGKTFPGDTTEPAPTMLFSPIKHPSIKMAPMLQDND